MVNPDIPQSGEHGSEFVCPEDVASFVDEALESFESCGREFIASEAGPALVYAFEHIGYDPLLTPNLVPYTECDIQAMDISEMDGPSHVEVHFAIDAPTPDGLRRLDRRIAFWNSGEIDDETRDYAHEKMTRDPDEPTAPKSMSKEDIHRYMEYLLGKLSLCAGFDEIEGLPAATPGITYGELEDIRKLLPGM